MEREKNSAATLKNIVILPLRQPTLRALLQANFEASEVTAGGEWEILGLKLAKL